MNNIQMNFSNNKERFIEGKHFYLLKGEILKIFKESLPKDFGLPIKFASQLYLWTELGALFHAKSINNDFAWNAYENLVDSYFRLRAFVQQIYQNQPKLQLVAQAVSESIEDKISRCSNTDEVIVALTKARYSGLISSELLERIENDLPTALTKTGKIRIYDTSECVQLLKAAAELAEKGIIYRDYDYKLMKHEGWNAITFGSCFYSNLVCNLFNGNFVGAIPSRRSFFDSLERKKYFLGYIPLPKDVPYQNENKWIVLCLDLLNTKMKTSKFGYLPLRDK